MQLNSCLFNRYFRKGRKGVNDYEDKLADDAQLLKEAQSNGRAATLSAYVKLSGPGWLQSAITLGGGSLTGSLYLGVLAGFTMLWLQPLAMILGIIMLSAIGYVTMSTGQRPFWAIVKHINPVLAWGWALASLVASMVWALPQYSLATGVLQQNLLPGLLGEQGALGDFQSKLIISITILVVTTIVTWNYGSGGLGVKLYELILKLMVAMIVICFIGVVIRLAAAPGGLNFGAIIKGFIPNPSTIFKPAPDFMPLLTNVPAEYMSYWWDLIVSKQRDVAVTAAATAVGINMTFLFPYSILRRKWGKEFRGLSQFDLATGMFIPFVIATSCIVIVAANQFHSLPQPGFVTQTELEEQIEIRPRMQNEYNNLLKNRVIYEMTARGETAELSEEDMEARVAALGDGDKYIAATLVTRDAFDLAKSLQPLTGNFFANVIFGLGVLGMTLSSITILMLISGFVVCEVLNLPHSGWPFRLGSLAAVTGAFGPFFWAQAAFWLAVPTSVFGFMLIPIAYFTFFLMMNQRSLLGSEMPTGLRRIVWNTLMGIAVTIITFSSVSTIWNSAGMRGMSVLGLFLLAALIAHVMRKMKVGASAEG